MAAVSVLVVDDDAYFLRYLADMVNELRSYRVVGRARSGAEAVHAARELHPSLVIMDVRMPGGTGPEATREILAGLPDTVVVAMSNIKSPHALGAMIAAGATGYLGKSSDGPEIQHALDAALRGTFSFSAELSPALMSAMARFEKLDGSHMEEPPELTATEAQLLAPLVEGLTNKRIGKHLGISESAVKARMTRLLNSLGADNRNQAVRRAIELGLVSPRSDHQAPSVHRSADR